MKTRDFLAISLLLGATGIAYGASADDDDPFGLADFNDEVDLLLTQATLPAHVELVQQQRDQIEQEQLDRELLQAVNDVGHGEGTVARVQDLIKRGADVTVKDTRWHYIPLHVALDYKRIPEELVAVLIAACPDSVNYRTIYGWTSLHSAILNNQNENIIKALLKAGADPDIPNEQETTSRQMARECGREHLLPVKSERGARTKPAVNPQALRK